MNLRQQISKKLIEYQSAVQSEKNEQISLMEADDNFTWSKQAQATIQESAAAVQQEAHQRISRVVTKCLEAIFDDPYEFEITFELKRGRTEANIAFVRNEISVDPLSATGGGVVDVAAMALRLACLSLRRPPLRKVLVLDEPFRFLSAEYRPRVRSLLQSLSDEMSIQFILVTHINELKCGKVVELR